MGNRTQDLRIEARVSSQLLRIHLIALPIAVRDRTQFAHVCNDHFVTLFLKLLADPDRVCARFHRDPHRRQIGKPLLDSRGIGTKPAPVNHFSVFVERAVMAPYISKVDTDVISTLAGLRGTSAMRCCDGFFVGNSLSDPKDLLIAFIGPVW